MNKRTSQEKKIEKHSLKQLQQFWVGLLDGDGSIQCNHWRKKTLQYRFSIKLKEDPKNLEMLQLISRKIGGTVRPVKTLKGPQILWVEDHQRRIWKLTEILHKYPPLTSRVQCQWQFLEECRERKSVSWLLEHRPDKYQNQHFYIREACKKGAGFLSQLHYWPLWCSGFIEAEGCFSLREGGSPSFSIGQKSDKFLIEEIRHYFVGQNQVSTIGEHFFFWQVYRRDVLNNIKNHCQQYPLLGEKSNSATRFFLNPNLSCQAIV